MCTEHFLMIRYKTNVILCALTRPVHCCAWISYYIYYNSYFNYLIILVKQTSRQIYALFSNTLHWFLGLAVSTPNIGHVDLCSSLKGGSNLTRINRYKDIFTSFVLYALYILYSLFLQVNALLRTLELQESAQRKGNFALFNCLVIGHTKYTPNYGVVDRTLRYRSPHRVLLS